MSRVLWEGGPDGGEAQVCQVEFEVEGGYIFLMAQARDHEISEESEKSEEGIEENGNRILWKEEGRKVQVER